MIRTIVVDDEALGRAAIRTRLTAVSDIDVVGEARDGPEAVSLIQSLRPDLVFLDIELPEFDGFEVLERVGQEHLPLVIFVTAFGQYAVKAFEAHALDYVLKPISDVRFHESLRRIREVLADETNREQAHGRLVNSLSDVRHADTPTASGGDVPRSSTIQRFVVKDKGRYRFIRTETIEWFKSASNYVQIHADGRDHLIRMTMNDLIEKLDGSRFARIHRSTIVNVDRVKEVLSHPQGDYDVIMTDGTMLRLGRTYRDRLLGSEA